MVDPLGRLHPAYQPVLASQGASSAAPVLTQPDALGLSENTPTVRQRIRNWFTAKMENPTTVRRLAKGIFVGVALTAVAAATLLVLSHFGVVNIPTIGLDVLIQIPGLAFTTLLVGGAMAMKAKFLQERRSVAEAKMQHEERIAQLQSELEQVQVNPNTVLEALEFAKEEIDTINQLRAEGVPKSALQKRLKVLKIIAAIAGVALAAGIGYTMMGGAFNLNLIVALVAASVGLLSMTIEKEDEANNPLRRLEKERLAKDLERRRLEIDLRFAQAGLTQAGRRADEIEVDLEEIEVGRAERAPRQFSAAVMGAGLLVILGGVASVASGGRFPMPRSALMDGSTTVLSGAFDYTQHRSDEVVREQRARTIRLMRASRKATNAIERDYKRVQDNIGGSRGSGDLWSKMEDLRIADDALKEIRPHTLSLRQRSIGLQRAFAISVGILAVGTIFAGMVVFKNPYAIVSMIISGGGLGMAGFGLWESADRRKKRLRETQLAANLERDRLRQVILEGLASLYPRR